MATICDGSTAVKLWPTTATAGDRDIQFLESLSSSEKSTGQGLKSVACSNNGSGPHLVVVQYQIWNTG